MSEVKMAAPLGAGDGEQKCKGAGWVLVMWVACVWRIHQKVCLNWAWWFMPIIPALERLRQEDCEFQVSLGYIARPVTKFFKRWGISRMLASQGSLRVHLQFRGVSAEE
jgi:hypothetical protein